jgi:hypothetical protein
MSFSSDLPLSQVPSNEVKTRSLLLRPDIRFEASRIKKDQPFWRVNFGDGMEMRGTWAEIEDCVWRAIDEASVQ